MRVGLFRKLKILSFVMALLVTAGAARVSAHDGLHEQITEVSARIKRHPRDASLYLKRGELHRLHRDWRRASADYDRAARLQPRLAAVESLPASRRRTRAVAELEARVRAALNQNQ